MEQGRVRGAGKGWAKVNIAGTREGNLKCLNLGGEHHGEGATL